MAVENANDWIISVDDHVIEPPNLWQDRLPARFKERGPKVLRDERGDAWHFEGKRIPVNGLVTMGGFERSTYNPLPVNYADIRPSCYDPKARLEAMNEDGIIASMVFPNLPRFCGQEFSEGPDREMALYCIQAYNDFIIDEWSASAPGRFIPCIITPLWDSRLAAAEIERCAAKGARAVTFSEQPTDLGLPSIHDTRGFWDPVFRTAEEAGVTLAVHLGSSSTMPWAPTDAPSMVPLVLMGWRAASTLTNWLFSSVFARFPGLRVTLSEGGIGWLPSTLGRCDYSQFQYRPWGERYIYHKDQSITDQGVGFTSWAHGDLTPSQVFQKNMRGCCIVEQEAHPVDSIRQVGADYIFLETDFPHADSTYPTTHKLVDEALVSFTEEERYALRRGNAESWYNFEAATPPVALAS